PEVKGIGVNAIVIAGSEPLATLLEHESPDVCAAVVAGDERVGVDGEGEGQAGPFGGARARDDLAVGAVKATGFDRLSEDVQRLDVLRDGVILFRHTIQ